MKETKYLKQHKTWLSRTSWIFRHTCRSDDGNAVIWAGVIDDLWKLGKPAGYGGPWKNTQVKANIPSDPYLIACYDKRDLELAHAANEPVTFTIEVDPVGNGPWMLFMKTTVNPGQKFKYEFPPSFQARWIRFSSNLDCAATALLNYEITTSLETVLLKEEFSIQLSPNPVSTTLSVSVEQGLKRQGAIEIYTLPGTKVYQTPGEVPFPHQINVSSYAPGIYFVKILSGGRHFTQKVVKSE